MIQRIQSIYLLAVTILMIVCMCNPVGTLIANTQEISEFGNLCITLPDGTKDYAPWALFVILLIVAILSFGTIFLFKKRMLQIRLCAVEMVLLLGSLVLYGLYYWITVKSFENFTLEHLQFGWAAPMPIVALILTYLASRAIFKDEMLVRSLDRIR